MRLSSDITIVIPISLKKNVRELKQGIFKQTGIPIDDQTVLFSGENMRKRKEDKSSIQRPEKTLYNSHTLAQSGLINQSVVNLRAGINDEQTSGSGKQHKPWLTSFAKKNKIVPNAFGAPTVGASRRVQDSDDTWEPNRGRDSRSRDGYGNPLPSKVPHEVGKKSNWRPRTGDRRVAPLPSNAGSRMRREGDPDSQNLSRSRQNRSRIGTMSAPRVQRVDGDGEEWAPRHSRRRRDNKVLPDQDEQSDEKRAGSMIAPRIQREGSAKSDWAPFMRRSQRSSRRQSESQSELPLSKENADEEDEEQLTRDAAGPRVNRVGNVVREGLSKRRSARKPKSAAANTKMENEGLHVKKITLGRKRKHKTTKHNDVHHGCVGVAREGEESVDWKPAARPRSKRAVRNTGNSSSMRIGDPSFASLSREGDVTSEWKPSARRVRRVVVSRNGVMSQKQTGEAAFSSVRREGSITSNWRPAARKRMNSTSSIQPTVASAGETGESVDSEILIVDEQFYEV